MGKRWASWVWAALFFTYGLLSKADQFVSNIRFLRSIPWWKSLVTTLFSSAHIIAGPALFFGGAWLIVLTFAVFWTATLKKRRRKTQNYTVTAFDSIQYIATQSQLSITFGHDTLRLATMAFLTKAQSGEIKLAGRRPDQTELVEIPSEEIAQMKPMTHYLPREEGDTVGPVSSQFAFINLAGNKICYESVLCDEREIAATWPRKPMRR